jgi:hypothetical protein
MAERSNALEFFSNQKRKLTLVDAKIKRNSEDEKRIRLDFAMPLTGQSEIGMPQEIGAAMRYVGELKNGAIESKVETLPFPQTIQFWATEASKRPMFSAIAAVDLKDLIVTRPKVSETADTSAVELAFHANFPFDKNIWDFVPDYHGKVFWCTFERTQIELTDVVAEKSGGAVQSVLTMPGSKKKGGKDAAVGSE